MEATALDAAGLTSAAEAAPSWRGFANGAMQLARAVPLPHILLVGEDAMFGRSMSEYLSDNQFRVTSVPDEKAMRAALSAATVDVLVLALPPQQECGALLAPRLCEESAVPVVMLSSQGEEADRIMALELGADECLIAPFSARELVARLRAILRRRRVDARQRKTQRVRAYRFGAWELNLNTRRLNCDGKQQIGLTNGEFSLLVALLAAGQGTLSRLQLLELSRLHDDEVYDRAVDMQIMRLRRKLEADCAAPRYLLTVRGAGYRIGVPVEPVY